jgi:hypothetical protein
MHTEPEDRLNTQEGRRMPALHIILIIIGVIGIVAAIYIPGWKSEPPIVEDPTPIVTVNDSAESPPTMKMPPAPDIPGPSPEPEAGPWSEETPVAVEVSLTNSGQELREMLDPAGASMHVTQILQADDLILRSAGLIDGFSQGLIPRKVLPLTPPKEKFNPRTIDGEPYVDPASYQRFNSYTKGITAVNADLLVAAFHRYRPLIELAYEESGYSAEDMDNALIRSLDYVLATPEPNEPLALKRKEAVFQYADPEMEQLPPLQKQLLRMGPENSARIKQWAEKLRHGLLGVSPILDEDNSIPN